MSSDVELKTIEQRLAELKGERQILLARRSVLLDSSLPMLSRMYKKRAKGYAAMGYTVTEKYEELLQANLVLEQ